MCMWRHFYAACLKISPNCLLNSTVNSGYYGHSRDLNLVSVLVRVCNNGVREKKIENILAGFTVKENT